MHEFSVDERKAILDDPLETTVYEFRPPPRSILETLATEGDNAKEGLPSYTRT